MSLRRLTVFCIAAAAWAAGSAGGALAGSIGMPPLDDHAGEQHVTFPLYASPDRLPPDASVAGVGDVDGDGHEDAAVMLGTTVWVTSSSAPASSAAGEPGWRGFRIAGAAMDGMVGLGDVNGDGLGEIAVGRPADGEVDVVFGRRDGATVDLGHLGADGFRIVDAAPAWGAGGGGNTCCGLVVAHTTLVDAGDQNGDGRPDVGFATEGGATVVYTPALPAGATVDAATADGFRLVATPGGGPWGVRVTSVGSLGDLNADGRDDLLVAWSDQAGIGGLPAADTATFAAGAVSPGAGGSVDLRAAPAAGTGFLIEDPDHTLVDAIAIGDQNGDGRRDVMLADQNRDPLGYGGTVAYAPPLGTVQSLAPLTAAVGFAQPLFGSPVFDAGDQDGDGIDEVGQPHVVRNSAAGPVAPGSVTANVPGGGAYMGFVAMLAGSVADRNGDGRRELLAVHADPYDRETAGAYTARWMLDTYLSTPAPGVASVDVPASRNFGVQVGATFTAPAVGGVTSLPAQGGAEVTFPDGYVEREALLPLVDAMAPTTHVSFEVGGYAPHAFQDGATYTARVWLETERGTVAWSAPQTFVYHDPQAAGWAILNMPGTDVPSSPLAGGPPAVAPARPPASPRSVARSVRTGTSRRDRLTGTARADVLRGYAGNDQLRGLGGNDELDGGAGADHLIGGAGRDALVGGSGNDDIDAKDGQVDTIRCGAGRDHVRADRRDHVSGCEHVRHS